MMTDVVPVTVYRREQCELCEQAIETIETVAGEAGIEVAIETVDIDSDPDLRERYGERIPVVLVDGREQFQLHVDPTVLVGVLREAAQSS
jgi:glutaredoxin